MSEQKANNSPADPPPAPGAKPLRSLMRSRAALLAAAGGGLVVLAFPPLNLVPLLWVGPALLFAAVRGRRPMEGLLLGTIFGLAVEGGGFYWIARAVSSFYHLYLTGGATGGTPATLLGLGAFLAWWPLAAILWGIWGWFLALWGDRWGGSFWWPGLVLLTLERFYPRVFPWNLGAGVGACLPFAQLARWIGLEGLTLPVLVVSALLERAGRCLLPWREGGLRRARSPLLWALGCLLLWGGAGWARLVTAGEESGTLRVGYLQPVVPLARKHSTDPGVRTALLHELERSSRRLAEKERCDLIVWAEALFPFSPEGDELARWAERLIGVPMIVGGEGVVEGRLTNRAFLLAPADGRLVVSVYDKRFLVPFGERVPLREALVAVGVRIPGLDLAAGDEVVVEEFRGVPVGVSICFEGIVRETARDLLAAGARLHVNLTEDLWYGHSSAPYQHLSLVTLRAVESGLPCVRIANGGISALIDPFGRVVARAALGERASGVFVARVPATIAPPPLSARLLLWVPWPGLLLPLLPWLLRGRKIPWISC